MKSFIRKMINKDHCPVGTVEVNENPGGPACAEINTWIDVLENTGKGLSRLAAATEPQFLSFGSLLQDFSLTADKISQLSIDAAQTLTSDDVEGAIDNLEKMLTRISLYLGQSEQELETNLKTLHSVIKIASEVENRLQGFGKIVRMMRMLGVTTRIENAQFDDNQTNFSNLSCQVLQLSEDIGDKSKGIYNGIENLKSFGNNHLAGIMAHNEKRSEQANLIIQNIQSCLGALKEKYDSSSVTAGSISTESQEIANQMNNIVMSMQFHDICRQRIEHVYQALSNQAAMLETLFDGDAQPLSHIIETCELQVFQLQETELTMRNAVSQMISSLTEIFHHTQDIGDMINRMVRSSDFNQKSSFEQMAAGIDHVAKLLESNQTLSTEIDGAVGAIVNMVKDVESFVAEINEIGLEIELIAVNGIINAAQLGEQGLSLSVLADAIQKLSVDARDQIQEVSAVLQEIGDSTKYLHFNNAENANTGVVSYVDDMIKDLNGFVKTLKNVTFIVYEKLNKVEQNSQPFVDAVNDNISQIQIHIQFKKEISNYIQQIQSVVDSMRIHHHTEFETEYSNNYQAIVQNYTMQEEREVHASFVKGHAVPGDLADQNENETMPVLQEDWGDNIELF